MEGPDRSLIDADFALRVHRGGETVPQAKVAEDPLLHRRRRGENECRTAALKSDRRGKPWPYDMVALVGLTRENDGADIFPPRTSGG